MCLCLCLVIKKLTERFGIRWEGCRDAFGKAPSFKGLDIGVITAHCGVRICAIEASECEAPI